MDKVAMGAFTGIVILSIAGTWWYLQNASTFSATNTPQTEETQPPPSDDTPVRHPSSVGASIGDENLVQFDCDGGQSLTAVFARDILGLTLPDGRQIELRQNEVVADMLFHDVSGSIEFRGSDGGASLIEDGETIYADCVARI